MAKEKSQADSRLFGILVDQHGREWEAVLEKATGHPCSTIRARFDAPYIPEQHYLAVDPVRQGRIEINYDAAIADRKAAHKAWHEALSIFAHGTLGQMAGQALLNPTPDMLTYAGPKPPAPEIPMAAQQGNKWILGQTDVMPAWAVPFFPPTVELVREFDDAPAFDDTPAEQDEASPPARRGRATARA